MSFRSLPFAGTANRSFIGPPNERMPRFAVLTHDHPQLHWDFLLEAGPVCRTWRLTAEPAPGRSVPAEPIADHRAFYLSYEGPVNGDRGTVRRWDAGTYAGDVTADGPVEVALTGDRLHGRCLLAKGDDGVWHATFAR